MSQYTPDAWIEREEENDPTAPWCSTCERHGEDCICNPDGDETVEQYEARQAAAPAPDKYTLHPDCDSGCLDQGVRVCEHDPRDLGRPLTDEAFRPKVGECDVCGGDQDKILPDGICMPCSISWEFHRANYETTNGDQPMNDYKAQAERTDEAERLLTPAIRRGAVNTEPAKRDAFVAQLIEAKAGPKYPEIQVELTGHDGNAFAVLGRVRQALRRAGVPAPEIEAFTKEATAGDYDHLLATAMAWVDAI